MRWPGRSRYQSGAVAPPERAHDTKRRWPASSGGALQRVGEGLGQVERPRQALGRDVGPGGAGRGRVGRGAEEGGVGQRGGLAAGEVDLAAALAVDDEEEVELVQAERLERDRVRELDADRQLAGRDAGASGWVLTKKPRGPLDERVGVVEERDDGRAAGPPRSRSASTRNTPRPSRAPVTASHGGGLDREREREPVAVARADGLDGDLGVDARRAVRRAFRPDGEVVVGDEVVEVVVAAAGPQVLEGDGAARALGGQVEDEATAAS